MFVLRNEKFVEKYRSFLKNYEGPIVYDVETTGLEIFKEDYIIGYALYLPECTRPFSKIYFPVRHNPWKRVSTCWECVDPQPNKRKNKFCEGVERFPDQLVYQIKEHETRFRDINYDPYYIAQMLEECIFKPNKKVFGWNIKFDVHATEKEGVKFSENVRDVMLGLHLVDENMVSFELKSVGSRFFGIDASEEKRELTAIGKKLGIPASQVMKSLRSLPLEIVSRYALQDTVLTYQIYESVVKKALMDEKIQGGRRTLHDFWEEEICVYSSVITRVEKNGLKIDREKCIENIENAQRDITNLKCKVADFFGSSFNPNSPSQVSSLLNIKKTDKYSLKIALEEGKVVPETEYILKLRELTKALGTYYEPWVELCDDNNILHAVLNIHGTVSGRLSGSRPYLLNIPNTKGAYDMKSLVIAEDNCWLASFDLSQIELRIAAHYCKDPEWVDIYHKEGDIHQATADLIGSDRRTAKVVNFATLYGMGSIGLMTSLKNFGVKITQEEAEEFLFKFREGKPKLVNFSKGVERFARKNGYIELWSGRRRHFPKRYANDADPHRAAFNNLVQGGAAELMRCIMMYLDKVFRMNEDKFPPRMLLQIHDDLLFQIPKENSDYWIPFIKNSMENRVKFSVPIRTSCKVGSRWSDLKDV